MMKRRDFVKGVGLASAAVALGGCTTVGRQTSRVSHAAARPIRFRPDGKLKIVQFTDTHWTEKGPADDAKTRRVLETVLDIEEPDFVVFTGDNVWGETCRGPQDVQSLLQPILDRRIEWAWVLGNHDDEGLLTRPQLMQIAQSLPFSRCQIGPADVTGICNYVIPVLDATGAHRRANLYMIDTLAYVPQRFKETVGGYDWIKRDQIDWYLATAADIKKTHAEKTLPALAFFHIPIPEYEQVWWSKRADGERKEWAGNPHVNSGFFLAMLEAGDIMGTFAGHAHINDYEGDLFGIRLCSGKGSGKSTYGNEFPRGGRVILMEEGVQDFETWIRLEDKRRLQWKKHVQPT